jgi:PAS domain S-box-containing protein
MNRKPKTSVESVELRRRAEDRLRRQRTSQRSKTKDAKPAVDTGRLPHELQVHQVELEMQNAELQEVRDRMDIQLEKYTDLFDFAPVGYFSMDDQGRILEVNLTGAALLGVERSRLINQRFPRFVVPESQRTFMAFLERVCAGTGKQVCEAALFRQGEATFWAGLQGTSGIGGSSKWCRVAVSDVSSRKQAEEVLRRDEDAHHRIEVLAASNLKLEQEIVQRHAVEESLKQSERDQSQLLAQSRQMQEELRLLSRQVLVAQEEERKRISRELHDVIAQALAAINLRLTVLKKEAALNPKGIDRHIASTQQLVERSVKIVHRFARELRPAVLDDLGLIPALHTFVKTFREQTRIRVGFSGFAGVEQLSGDKRTVLFRVAQEALTNVARHARASRAEVQIRALDGGVCMKIKDNGQGFQAEGAPDSGPQKRLGLLGMRERLEMVGGSFSIRSTPGKGTTIQVQMPLANR